MCRPRDIHFLRTAHPGKIFSNFLSVRRRRELRSHGQSTGYCQMFSPSAQWSEKLFVKWFLLESDIEYPTFSYAVYHVQKKKINRLALNKRRPKQIRFAVLFKKGKSNSPNPSSFVKCLSYIMVT